MTISDLPGDYSWRVKKSMFGVEVSLQKKLFWRFYETRDVMIPIDSERECDAAELIAIAKEELLRREAYRLRFNKDMENLAE